MSLINISDFRDRYDDDDDFFNNVIDYEEDFSFIQNNENAFYFGIRK